mgnify:CR=1 FL=1
MTVTLWQTAPNAPRAEDDYSYSRTFIAVLPNNPNEPFPCKTRNGKFYDLDDYDVEGGWEQIDPTGLLWTDMPKPTISVMNGGA